MRFRVSRDLAQQVEIRLARAFILFFQPLFVGDALFLHIFDVNWPPALIVTAQRLCGLLVTQYPDEAACQIDRIMDAAIEAEAAERIVDVSGVSDEEGTSLLKRRRDPLMHTVEITVDDRDRP